MTPATIAEPITGREDFHPVDRPERALAQFYRAFNGRDLELMAQNWAPGEDVVMCNPLGGIERGWPRIRSVYEAIFAARATVMVEFHDYTLHLWGDVFAAIGRERGRLQGEGIALDLRIRTSRIFRRLDGVWRQVHHHGSFDDPVLLSAYQAAIRRR